MPDSDDPFVLPDPSQRPRPGLGRRGLSEATLARGTFARAVEPEPLADSARASLGLGLNPLVQAATPLLLLIGQIRTSAASMDVSGLRRHTLEEIRRFEDGARAAGVRNEIVLAARYTLCAGLDEAVLSTPWGAQSEWAGHPLVVALHRAGAWGGEKFFEMLDKVSADPARHIDILELQYLILALGFTGKYQMLDRGSEKLADLQRELHRKIRGVRGAAPAELSLRWRGLEDRRNRLIRYIPWWVVGAAASAILAVTFTVYHSRLSELARPIQERLSTVGMQDFSAPPPLPPAKGPTLKQLLRQQEEAGALTVDEKASLSIVTLRGRDLFASGSASLNPAYESTIGEVADALNKLSGRVMVIGHTDDQPIRSLTFPDNIALSRARADSVANVLKRTLSSPARVQVNGVGATQRVAAGSDPESRARNRRVEIRHLSER